MEESKKTHKPQKSKSSLEEVQKKLYSTHFEPKHNRAKLSKKKYDLKSSWEKDNDSKTQPETPEGDYWGPNAQIEPERPDKKLGSFSVILTLAILFFVGSLGYAYFIFSQANQTGSENDVSIRAIGPVSVGGGEQLSLDVIVQNNNAVAMELVDLIIDYPVGTKDPSDLVTDLRRERIPLGDIPAGSVVRHTVSSALFGEENLRQQINATVQFRLEGSNAIFERQYTYEVVLGSSPVRLVVDGLKEISSGQELELTATLSSNSSNTLEDVMLLARYPFGFTFESANIEPSIDDNIWFLDTLEPEEEVKIVLRGEIRGQERESRVFRFNTGIKSEEANDQIGIVWGNVIHETSIQQSFANLALSINGSFDNSVSVSGGEVQEGILLFNNNTEEDIRNIEIELELLGDALDKRSVNPSDGFYSSADNVIRWNPETSSKFNSLESGESLELSFRFSALDLQSLDTRIPNPEINLVASAEAVRISGDRLEEYITNNTSTRLSVLSDIDATVYTAYNEGPLSNSGPIPPVAEQDTMYTLVFEVANGNNDLENARFVATLPSYVEWNRTISPANSDVRYNESTREVVWNIGDIQSGVGFETPPLIMYANVTLNPSLSQVGSEVELTRDVRLIGFDNFAKENITQTSPNATTRINGRAQFDGHASVTE